MVARVVIKAVTAGVGAAVGAIVETITMVEGHVKYTATGTLLDTPLAVLVATTVKVLGLVPGAGPVRYKLPLLAEVKEKAKVPDTA